MFLECGSCGQRLTASHAPPDARGVQCPHCGATVPIFDQNTLVSRRCPARRSQSRPSPNSKSKATKSLAALAKAAWESFI